MKLDVAAANRFIKAAIRRANQSNKQEMAMGTANSKSAQLQEEELEFYDNPPTPISPSTITSNTEQQSKIENTSTILLRRSMRLLKKKN